MAMTTYWDLDESERAALTEAEVQRYLDAELMTKGVLKVRPLELEPVPTAPEPTTKVFVIRVGGKYGRDSAGVAFSTLEAAQAFVSLRPMRLGSDYLENASVEYTIACTDPEIAEVALFTEAAKDAVKSELKKAAAIKAANDRRREEYEKAVREQNKALEGLWEDWARCREDHAKLRAVAETLEDYKRTAGGDERVAMSFLAKVYPPSLIEQAAERFGFGHLISRDVTIEATAS